MEQIIGKIKVKIDGDVAIVDVTSEGDIVLSDGRKESLSKDQFEAVKKALEQGESDVEEKTKEKSNQSPQKCNKKKKSKSNAAVVVLSILLATILTAGIGGIYSGVLSVNIDNMNQPATVNPQGDRSELPNINIDDMSSADMDEVESAILIARVVTEDGQVKEIILGQIENQENSVDLTPSPENSDSSESESNESSVDGDTASTGEEEP